MKQYLKNTWDGLYTIFVGMKVTLKHLFIPAVTIQYPDVREPMPERVRNRLYVNMDDCIGCDQCAKACPVSCIDIETVKSLPDEDLGKTTNGKKKVLWVTKFDIDIAKCCYCQLCVFPCPTECIWMTDVYEFSEFERENLVYNFATLTTEEAEEKKKNYEEYKAKKDAEKEAAKKAKQAKASSGSASSDKTSSEKAKPAGKQEGSSSMTQEKPSKEEKKDETASSDAKNSGGKTDNTDTQPSGGKESSKNEQSQDDTQNKPKDNSQNNSDKKEEQ